MKRTDSVEDLRFSFIVFFWLTAVVLLAAVYYIQAKSTVSVIETFESLYRCRAYAREVKYNMTVDCQSPWLPSVHKVLHAVTLLWHYWRRYNSRHHYVFRWLYRPSRTARSVCSCLFIGKYCALLPFWDRRPLQSEKWRRTESGGVGVRLMNTPHDRPLLF